MPASNNEEDGQQRASASSDNAPVSPLEDSEYIGGTGKDSLSAEKLSEGFRQNLSSHSLEKRARDWGVSAESLQQMGVGFDKHAYTFPMKSAGGQIVGHRLRPVKGGKLTLAGGHLGLFIPEGVTPCNAEIIAEGESDTASALTLGFRAIGRPGATAVVSEVLRFFSGAIAPCPCIIADGDQVGVEGAERLADALLAANIPCRLIVPPKPHGDLREWHVDGGLTREQLQQAIEAEAVRYPLRWIPGFFQMPNALLRNGVVAKVGDGPFALLCVIQSFYAGGDSIICPDRKVLAELLGVGVGTIDRYKRTLKEAGLLDWQTGHTGRCNEYWTNFGPILTKKKEKGRKTNVTD